jgi:hypothetical protein
VRAYNGDIYNYKRLGMNEAELNAKESGRMKWDETNEYAMRSRDLNVTA